MDNGADDKHATDGSPPEVGGDSVSDIVANEEEDPPVEAEVVDEDIAPAVRLVDVRAVARREVRRALAWKAPLPPPEEYGDYKELDPALADAIREDFRTRTELDAKIVEHEIASHDRELALQEREQRLREKESAADVTARWFVLALGALVVFGLSGLGFYVLMWGPFDEEQWRVAGAAAFTAPLGLLAGIILLRGRMTANERDVYRSAIPSMTGRQSTTTPVQRGDETPAMLDDGTRHE
jgi:hypothetical protein